MRKAVMAQNLGVPIENLGKLFEFATQRAADTGESVDFLVNSIVTGIGRKSPLILDNLGISAIALKEKMNGVAIGTASVGDVAKAVGKIAEEELNKIGDAAATNGQKIQSLAASWDNVKLAIGRAVSSSNEFKLVSDLIFGLNGLLDGTNEEQDKIKSGAERIFNAWKSQGKITKEFSKERIKALKEENKALIRGGDFANENTRNRRRGNLELIKLLKGSAGEISKNTKEEVRNIEFLDTAISSLKEEQTKATGSRLADINKEIQALELEIKALKRLGTEITRLPQQTAIYAAKITSSLDTRALDQSIQQGAPTLPLTLSTEGTFGASEQFKQLQQATQASARYAEQQDLVAAASMRAQNAASAYGSILGSVGQIAQASGDTQMASILNVAATTIQAVATMIPALFSQATSSAVASGAALPFPANIAAIATGVAAVASAFSGIGGGGGGGGATRTSIDTRSFQSPTTNRTASAVSQQTVKIEVEGRIDNKTIALSNKKGTKELQR